MKQTNKQTLTLISVGVFLAMPEAKAPGCVIETLIELIIWIIKASSSIQSDRYFQSNFYEWECGCFNSDFTEGYSAGSNR